MKEREKSACGQTETVRAHERGGEEEKCTFVRVAFRSGTCMLAGYVVVRGKRALNI